MSASPYSGAEFKRSILHFFMGKFISASLNIVILLWLVRLLVVDEYGVYVSLVAGMEFSLSVTSLGLPWLAGRYLPEFRMHANSQQLARFIWQLITLIFFFTLAGALLLFIVMPWLLAPMNLMQYADLANVYLLIMIIEGIRRNIQECVLDPLLLQGYSQLSQVIRNSVLLIYLVFMTFQGDIYLKHVVIAELCGTVIGTGFGLFAVINFLRNQRDFLGKSDWQLPAWSTMRSTARHMYISYLITLSYGSHVFIFLTQKYLGVETTALLGFLLNLYSQICRYLPATLLFNLIRPKLIASYVGENGGMVQLMRNVNLVGKLSLFVLMPFLIFAWLAAGDLSSLLSGGKFTHSGYYFGGLLLMLIPYSQRHILETVAVSSKHSHLCFSASSLAVLTMPLAYVLFKLGVGLWAPIIAMVCGQFIFNTTLIVGMMLATTYKPDSWGILKLVIAAFIGWVLITLIRVGLSSTNQLQVFSLIDIVNNIKILAAWVLAQQYAAPTQNWLSIFILGGLAICIYLLVAYFFKPFNENERLRLNRLLKYNIFVW